jgi:cation diffusion facilitator family transporter
MQSSRKVIYSAIFANVVIAAGKYVAAVFSGSSSMLAEAVHTTIDTGNELLLLWGIKRSSRAPDELHPFGHGKALYFYSLLVAIYILTAGGGFTIYEGIKRLHSSETTRSFTWNYVVLAISFVFEAYSWQISRRELLARQTPGESLWDRIRASKDPSVYTVFIEDSAALVGLVIAFVGVLLEQLFHNNVFDAAGSILIGVLLTVVAVFLARESGALLLGEAAHPAQVDRIKNLIKSDPDVSDVGDVLTMQLGPEEVLLTAEIKFRLGLSVQQLEGTIDPLKPPYVSRIPRSSEYFWKQSPLRVPSRPGRPDLA